MRQMLSELRETLAEFSEQPDWPMLVIRAGDVEGGLVLNQLEAVEAENDKDMFFRFPHPLETTADDWTVKAMVGLKLGVERSNRLMCKTAPNEDLLPATPASLLDARLSLVERWRIAIGYLGELLPDTKMHRLVIAAMPCSLGSMPEYSKLVGALMTVSHETRASHVRVIVRDPRGELLPHIRSIGARFLTYSVDLSTEALVDGMVAQAANPDAEPDDRMKSLLQLAFMDFAHSRIEASLEKFGRLATFYAIRKQPMMQGVVLYGAAQALDRVVPDKKQVKDRLQQAVALALEANAWPLLLEVLMTIVPVCMALKDYEDAKSYADSAAKIAKGTFLAGRYVDALLLRGDAEFALSEPRLARETWEEADLTAVKANTPELRRLPLERLESLFKKAQMRPEQEEIRRSLASIPKALS